MVEINRGWLRLSSVVSGYSHNPVTVITLPGPDFSLHKMEVFSWAKVIKLRLRSSHYLREIKMLEFLNPDSYPIGRSGQVNAAKCKVLTHNSDRSVAVAMEREATHTAKTCTSFSSDTNKSSLPFVFTCTLVNVECKFSSLARSFGPKCVDDAFQVLNRAE